MESIDVVIMTDVTGSMSPAIFNVRKNIRELVDTLFNNIPNLRIGIATIGDYCDGSGLFNKLDLTNNKDEIKVFLQTVKATGGGDSDEAYEYALNQARSLNWSAGKNKALVMIGDAEPHSVGYRYGSITNKLNWRNEAKLLTEANIKIYSVQCLAHYNYGSFWRQLAEIGGTPALKLEQFGQVVQLLTAITYKQAGKLSEYEALLRATAKDRIDPSLVTNLDLLMGRKASTRKGSVYSGHAVEPSRFQILFVGTDMPIKNFVQENGLVFKQGRGFYEFTKPETVQSYKEILIQDRETGEMFTGNKAREIAGIPIGTTAKVKPTILTKYRVFVQSTSNNRKLMGGTNFLYEVS
jgi:hypothetical protein